MCSGAWGGRGRGRTATAHTPFTLLHSPPLCYLVQPVNTYAYTAAGTPIDFNDPSVLATSSDGQDYVYLVAPYEGEDGGKGWTKDKLGGACAPGLATACARPAARPPPPTFAAPTGCGGDAANYPTTGLADVWNSCDDVQMLTNTMASVSGAGRVTRGCQSKAAAPIGPAHPLHRNTTTRPLSEPDDGGLAGRGQCHMHLPRQAQVQGGLLTLERRVFRHHHPHLLRPDPGVGLQFCGQWELCRGCIPGVELLPGHRRSDECVGQDKLGRRSQRRALLRRACQFL